jgi:multicomponent K+:H+ antiporter subunit G
MMPLWLDALIAFFIVLGALFALVGSYGLAKLGDFMKRLHGPTKASTLGVGCVLLASIAFWTWTNKSFSAHELLITLFVFMTAPISAHLLVKAAMKIHAGKNAALTPPPQPPTPTSANHSSTAHR